MTGLLFDDVLRQLERTAVSFAINDDAAADEIEACVASTREAAREMVLDYNFKFCALITILVLGLASWLTNSHEMDWISRGLFVAAHVALFLFLWALGRMVIALDVTRNWRKDWIWKSDRSSFKP